MPSELSEALKDLISRYGYQAIAEEFAAQLNLEYKHLRERYAEQSRVAFPPPSRVTLSKVNAYSSATTIANNLESVLWHAQD